MNGENCGLAVHACTGRWLWKNRDKLSVGDEAVLEVEATEEGDCNGYQDIIGKPLTVERLDGLGISFGGGFCGLGSETCSQVSDKSRFRLVKVAKMGIGVDTCTIDPKSGVKLPRDMKPGGVATVDKGVSCGMSTAAVLLNCASEVRHIREETAKRLERVRNWNNECYRLLDGMYRDLIMYGQSPMYPPGKWEGWNGEWKMRPCSRKAIRKSKRCNLTHKRENIMSKLLNHIRRLALTEDDKALLDQGLEDPTGVMTDAGEEVLLELLWKANRVDIAKRARELAEEEKAAKK